MTGISFYCFLWRLISVRRVRASNGRQNRFLYRSHRNGQSRKNIVFMRLCGVSGIHFLRCGEQIILLFFINNTLTTNIPTITYKAFYFFNSSSIFLCIPSISGKINRIPRRYIANTSRKLTDSSLSNLLCIVTGLFSTVCTWSR